MTYYLEHSEWFNSSKIPEGMNLDMINSNGRLDTLLKPALKDKCKNKIVVDLGCGTGVLGIHAVNHGAKFVYFVERDVEMIHILTNTLAKILPIDSFKIIQSDVESLSVDMFTHGTPDIFVSEFYGPRMFDEGYVNYTGYLRNLFPECYFIPETFKVDFYLLDNDNNYPIWPNDESLLPHFKFMYKEKGFAQYIEFDHTKHDIVDSIIFNANKQEFKNIATINFDCSSEKLLIAKAWATHTVYKQVYTTFGWFLDGEDQGKSFNVYYDVDNYFNPRKIEISV